MEQTEEQKTGSKSAASKPGRFPEERNGFAADFLTAIRKRDPARVREMAEQAGEENRGEALEALCRFLVPPASKWRTPRRKRGWPEARAAAVRALGRMNRSSVYPVLTQTLACERDRTVRAAASQVVRSIGPPIVGCLAQAVRAPVDWDLGGMLCVIGLLGELPGLTDSDRRVAGMALIDVLYEGYPCAPKRWSQPAREIGRVTALCVTVATAMISLRMGSPILLSLVLSWIVGQLAGLTVKMAASVVMSTAHGGADRAELGAAAAESIIRLDDKRAIPGLLQLVFDAWMRHAGARARTALKALLPLVTPQDRDLFSHTDIEALNGLIGQPLSPELAVGTLHALECVGNSTSLRRVRRVAKRARTMDVRTAAERAVQALEEREAQIKLSQTLLRGAGAPPAAPRDLLRAATPQAVPPPQELLRATNGEQSG